MRYQLASVLAQVKHLQRVQVLEKGQVEDWVFPLERALEKALDELRVPQQDSLAQAEERVEVLEPGQWSPDLQFESRKDFQ